MIQVRETVRSMLSNGHAAGSVPRALIVPHAGYVYSGPVAATAHSRLIPFKEKYRRVVMLGPCHRVPLSGLASSSADACGAAAVSGLLIVARRRGLNVRTLDLRNSGDTAGGREQVVGYGSWLFEEGKSCDLAA